MLQSISKWKCLIIFCYTEVLFLRHSEANRTHIFLEQAAQSVWKTFFRNIQKTISRKANVVAPNLRNISGRRCLWWNLGWMVLFLVILRASSASSVFGCITRPLLLWKWSNKAWSRQTKKRQWLYKRDIVLKEKFIVKEQYK